MKRLIVLLALLCATPAHATVNEVFARNDYVADGSTTSFPYTFRIINQADVLVLVDGVLQTLNVAYTVIGVDNPGGGAVIFSTAPLSPKRVALLRAQRLQQLSIYTPNEAFPAKRIESDLDKNAMVDQRQEEELDRSLRFDRHSLYREVFVDDPIAGKCLAWNAARTRVVSADCSGGAGGVGTGNVIGNGVAGQATFWTGTNTIAGDGKFLWDNASKFLTVGTFPIGPAKPGNIFAGLIGPSDATGMQNLQLQTVQGDPSLIGLVTLGNDRVGISSWNFRGTGADNPIYGANFGVVFNTNGVANGLEIDVQNDSATNYQGQALWLNGSTRAAGASGTVGHRANAILIDTQDGSKWERGILFKEGFVGNGATGSIEKMGIHFEQSQDADFIVIQPRQGASANVAMKLTNPEFTTNRFVLLNSGAIRVGNTMTGSAFPSYAFVEDQTTGLYMEADAVLGFAIKTTITCPVGGTPPCYAGSRRMSLGAVAGPPAAAAGLNLWPWGSGANQGGAINLFDPTSVHSVGLMAPDFVGNSFRIKLPDVPGAAGQCLITDGGFPNSTWSYAACGTGGGGGAVSASGVLTLNRVLLGDGGSAVKAMAGAGTTTQVLHGNASGLPAFGPVVVADISATGTPSSTTFLRGDGTWASTAGSGTVTTTGTPLINQIAFFTASTVLGASNAFTWDNALKKFTVGLGNDPTSPSKAVIFNSRSIGGSDPTVQIAAAFAGANPLVNHPVPMTMIGDFLGGGAMPSGFGVTMEFGLHDNAGAGTFIPSGFINSNVQVVSPASTSMTFGAMNTGTAFTMLTLNPILSVLSTQLQIGTGNTGLGSSDTRLSVASANGTSTQVVRLESLAGGTAAQRTALALVRTVPGSQMIDGAAVRQDFILRDIDAIDNINARILVERIGNDGTGQFRLQTAINSFLQDRVVINSTGQFVFIPTTTVGSFQLAANTTRTTELQFFTQNNTNAVGFVAPDTSTGNFMWKLPQQFGAAGSILTNDGSGQLTWATFPSTLTLTTLNTTNINFSGGAILGGGAASLGPNSISTTGGINTSGNIGANQYFAQTQPGFTSVGAKVAGACSFFIVGGIITNVTGC